MALDELLRRRATERGQSLNMVILEAIARGSDLVENPLRRRDLRDIAGTWHEDESTNDALGL